MNSICVVRSGPFFWRDGHYLCFDVMDPFSGVMDITLKAKNFAAKIFTAEKFRGFRGCSERKIKISQDVIFAVGKILKNPRDVIFADLKNFRETFRGFSKKNAKTPKTAKFITFKVFMF